MERYDDKERLSFDVELKLFDPSYKDYSYSLNIDGLPDDGKKGHEDNCI